MAKIKNEKDSSLSPRDVLNSFVQNINSHYQKNVMSLGSDKLDVEKYPTGILSLDIATEGGIPRGRTIIYVGDESTFKSTAMYMTAGAFQRICGNCMKGHITEVNFKKTKVALTENKSNDVFTVVKEGNKLNKYSKLFLADRSKRNVYCPGEIITHTKDLTLYRYELECSECTTPQYSIFLLIDAEKNYTKNWARRFGVIHYYTILGGTEYSQMTGDILREGLKMHNFSFFGVDSVDALGPKEEDESSIEEWQISVQARVWNKNIRIITGKLNSTQIYSYTNKEGKKIKEERRAEPTICLIQQWREKIGAYGDNRVMGGGRGKTFASSLTIAFSEGKKDWITIDKKKTDVKGMEFNFFIKKHKTGRPYRKGSFYYDVERKKLLNEATVIDYGVKYSLVNKKGAWFMYGDLKFQGLSKFTQALEKDKKLFNKLKNEVMEIAEAEKN